MNGILSASPAHPGGNVANGVPLLVPDLDRSNHPVAVVVPSFDGRFIAFMRITQVHLRVLPQASRGLEPVLHATVVPGRLRRRLRRVPGFAQGGSCRERPEWRRGPARFCTQFHPTRCEYLVFAVVELRAAVRSKAPRSPGPFVFQAELRARTRESAEVSFAIHRGGA